MRELNKHDLKFAAMRIPNYLRASMAASRGHIMIGGGFLRSVVLNEIPNDIDVFVGDKNFAGRVAHDLSCAAGGGPQYVDTYRTDNAISVKNSKPMIQVIHRWVFPEPEALLQSFDFTCCQAVLWHNGTQFVGLCSDDFYPDVAAKRLVYTQPVREEAPGGSMLRVLKYYQRGFRIPLDSLAQVIWRVSVDAGSAEAILNRLVEVDPQIDPNHFSHLPA